MLITFINILYPEECHSILDSYLSRSCPQNGTSEDIASSVILLQLIDNTLVPSFNSICQIDDAEIIADDVVMHAVIEHDAHSALLFLIQETDKIRLELDDDTTSAGHSNIIVIYYSCKIYIHNNLAYFACMN